MARHVWTCVWMAVLVACAASGDDIPTGHTIRDSAGVRIVENRTAIADVPWTVSEEPTLTIGRADGGGDYELYDVVGALRLGNGTVVVANAGTLELRFYDRFGAHLRSAGRRGGGPGEFQTLMRISRFVSDSILAVDVVGHSVSYFDSAGSFGRSVRLEPSAEIPLPNAVGVFADGGLLALPGVYALGGELPVRSERDEEGLFVYRADGTTAFHVGSVLGTERDIIPVQRPNARTSVERWPRILGRKTAYAAAGSRFYVADNETYEIRVYSPEPLGLTLMIRKQHEHLTVMESDVSFVRDSLLATRSGPAQQMVSRSFEHRPPPPTTMPAFAPDIQVDTEQCLWVREFLRPGDPRVAWSVFSEDGVFLGMVETPSGLKLLDIGSDYILGLRLDEDDVEYLEIYDLVRGS